MINIIAAIGKNNELGKDNKLVFNVPEDLKYFKEITTNKTVVMGYNTYKSIGKALPNRTNIVLTKKDIILDDVFICNNYKDILSINEDIFIIGGESIYKLFLPYADNLYLTEIDKEVDADTFFPKFNKNLYDKEIIKENSFNNLKYKFVVYKRR